MKMSKSAKKMWAYLCVLVLIATNGNVFNNTETKADTMGSFETCTVDNQWHEKGGFSYLVGDWSNSTAQIAVDTQNPDHIRIKPLTSDWGSVWSLQVKKTISKLKVGKKYTITMDMYSPTNEGAYKMTGDTSEEQRHEPVTGTSKLSATITANAEGQIEFVVGLGWMKLDNSYEFSNVWVTNEAGKVVYPGDGDVETTTEAPTDPNMPFEECIVDSDWHVNGGYEYYAATWNHSTARMAVDVNDSDHVKIQQLSSDWGSAWGTQIKKKVSGLIPGHTYVFNMDMYSPSDNGSYKVTGDTSEEQKHYLAQGVTTLTTSLIADSTGSIEYCVGLGWVGVDVILDFSNVIVYNTSGDEVYPEGQEETTPVPESPTLTNGFEYCEVDEAWHEKGGYEYYVGAWNGSTAKIKVDGKDENHVWIQQLSSNWGKAWGLQLRKTVKGLIPGATYKIYMKMYSGSTDGSYKMTGDATEEEKHALRVGTTPLSATVEADENGQVSLSVGLGFVGTSVMLEFSNPVVVDADGKTVYPKSEEESAISGETTGSVTETNEATSENITTKEQESELITTKDEEATTPQTNIQKLGSPTGLAITDGNLQWQPVENASSYLVMVDGKAVANLVATGKDLSGILTETKQYRLGVVALAKGYEDSDEAFITYENVVEEIQTSGITESVNESESVKETETSKEEDNLTTTAGESETSKIEEGTSEEVTTEHPTIPRIDVTATVREETKESKTTATTKAEENSTIPEEMTVEEYTSKETSTDGNETTAEADVRETTTEPVTTTVNTVITTETTKERPTTVKTTTTVAVTTDATTKSSETTTVAVTTTAKASVKVGKTAVTKATKKKSAKKIKVSLKKITGANGYQVAVYKTKKNAKKNAKALVKKFVKKTKATLKGKKLKKAKKLYVRARAYATVSGAKVYGAWSRIKKAKIK